jgi:hypothetical protein
MQGRYLHTKIGHLFHQNTRVLHPVLEVGQLQVGEGPVNATRQVWQLEEEH